MAAETLALQHLGMRLTQVHGKYAAARDPGQIMAWETAESTVGVARQGGVWEQGGMEEIRNEVSSMFLRVCVEGDLGGVALNSREVLFDDASAAILRLITIRRGIRLTSNEWYTQLASAVHVALPACWLHASWTAKDRSSVLA